MNNEPTRYGLTSGRRLGLIIATLMGLLVSCRLKGPPLSEGITPRPTNTMAQEVARSPATPTATPEEPLVATVNGLLILLADYQKQVARFEAAMAAQGFDSEGQEGQAKLTQMRRQVLDSILLSCLVRLVEQ
jgi:hypothetical protein